MLQGNTHLQDMIGALCLAFQEDLIIRHPWNSYELRLSSFD